MNKKIKFVFLGFFLFILALIPNKAFAYDMNTPYEYGNLWFQVTYNEENIYITGLTDENVKEVEIPSSIDGIPVIEINNYAFDKCYNLEKVTLSEGLKKIDTCAFRSCTSLTSIDIPASVTYISGDAFYGCSSLQEINIDPLNNNYRNENGFVISKTYSEIRTYPQGIELGNFPDGIECIGQCAFGGYQKLTNLYIPEGFMQIDEYAFSSCSNLKKVILPESMTRIGNYAFDCCTNLTSINIPSSVTYIEYNAFNGCEKLTLSVVKGSYGEEFAIENNIKYTYSQEITKAKGSFISGGKEFKDSFGFIYDDNFFADKASVYNHHLATMSLSLAFSAYNADSNTKTAEENGYRNEDRNVKDVLNKCGFTKLESMNYDKKPTPDSIACVIAQKPIDDCTLIAIAVRGGGYESEWAGNFSVGKTGDHKGFKSAADQIYNKLDEYIENKNIEGNIKIWITGFSRAAATSNLLAAELNNICINKKVNYNNESIYAYCFATPAGATVQNDPFGDDYNNIFNIINFYDPVPLVAPNFWGIEAYGKTKIFPVKGIAYEASKYEKNMIKYLKSMGETEYRVKNFKAIQYGNNLGIFLRKLITACGHNNVINTRNNYVDNGIEKELTNRMYEIMGKGEKNWLALVIDVVKLRDIISGNTLLIKTAIENIDLLALVHAEQAYYISWMQSMDSNYVEGAVPNFCYKKYRMATVNCPVDIYVYDSSNTLVGSIINEELQELEDSSIITYIDEDGQKVIWLPIDAEYRIETKARENCKTTFTIKEFEEISSEAERIVTYNEIDMNKNEVINSTIGVYSDEDIENNSNNGSAVEYTVQKDDEKLNATNDISGDEIKNYTYNVNVRYNQNQGEAIGGGIYTLGDFCQVKAENKVGYVFDGWYINGNKISSEKTYRFAVKENTEVEAVFKICIHSKTSNKIITKANLSKNGKITYKCTTCGKDLSYTIYYPKTISLSKTAFTYNKKVQKPTITVKDSKGKALKNGTDYTVSYSNKNSKKVGQYTITIIFKGNYSGTKILTYRINPKGVSLKKLTKGKKQFKVTWNKNTTQTTGYQIQYSTNKKFKSGNKTVKVKKNKITSTAVKKLKAKKKYYVRIRTYKTVNGKTYYSGWSKVKNITTKK